MTTTPPTTQDFHLVATLALTGSEQQPTPERLRRLRSVLSLAYSLGEDQHIEHLAAQIRFLEEADAHQLRFPSIS